MSCDDSVIASTGHLSVQDTLYVISFDPVSNSTGEFYSLVIELGLDWLRVQDRITSMLQRI